VGFTQSTKAPTEPARRKRSGDSSVAGGIEERLRRSIGCGHSGDLVAAAAPLVLWVKQQRRCSPSLRVAENHTGSASNG
jgi:hypothetical protein